jgi:hypothetical protein
MSYRLTVEESDVFGKGKFANAKGHTECVEFIQQATGAPATRSWRAGLRVADCRFGQILRGTAIATFDEGGRYPVDDLGRHAAIYLAHDIHAIHVMDQWNAQGEVKMRPIWFKRSRFTRRSNDGDTFYVVE